MIVYVPTSSPAFLDNVYSTVSFPIVPVTVAVNSGTALTAGGKVEGIVSGETVEFTTTGSQTEVGSSKNTYELVWKSAKATNYTLAKES